MQILVSGRDKRSYSDETEDHIERVIRLVPTVVWS
jgi:hypothetical protein